MCWPKQFHCLRAKLAESEKSLSIKREAEEARSYDHSRYSRITIDFTTRLAAARKQRGLTQQALTEHVGVHVTQIRRYEAGTSGPPSMCSAT